MNRSRTYTPAVSGDRNIGTKASIAISVAPKSGIEVLRPIEVIASRRVLPRLRSIKMPSIITIALSTNIPIAKMNDANDTRCIEPSKYPSSRNVPTTIVSRLKPIIRPLLSPIVSISTTTTITIDSNRLTKNVIRASVTRSG